MAVGFLSLPTELLCHILLLLTPRDLCCGAIPTCKTLCYAVQNSAHIQYKLELYAQGFTETATLDSIGISRKMHSLKKLESMWRSDFHVNIVFQAEVTTSATHGAQYMKSGLWWTRRDHNLFIQECNPDIKLFRTWPSHSLSLRSQHILQSVIVDPVQDLMVVVSSPSPHVANDADQDHCVFSMEFYMLSSQLPHPDSACASLECKHTAEVPAVYCVVCLRGPVIYGDRIVIPYFIEPHPGSPAIHIQVVDWRKGQAQSFPLGQQSGQLGMSRHFHLIDQQTLVVIGTNGPITLYTLQEPDGSPQRRITYILPQYSLPRPFYYVVHVTTSFRGAAARPDLMPGYVPSLEPQIMVLEVVLPPSPVILVIDMAIFLQQAVHLETPVEIPWSDWGPHHTWCFPHHPSHRISVFGSRMAYALPQDRTPEPGERLEALSTNDRFYVHIWDFNRRAIARSEHTCDPDSPNLFVRKPGRLAELPLCRKITSNNPYIATVCHTSFSTRNFSGLFLDQDRFTMTWLRSGSVVDIQVVSPAHTEVGSDPTN
ncbi:uncharacterized protein EDB91DRAFT_210809 [Suillus paluster]|uniref:uncharacterized protein n=1 Tax=Suillus paluster TaxID=48578 RepID=UPI001B866A3A|nr:uncharacterized protein EDB91DRAFT_210809 [Suillus paluster]KAG1744119.1 hypothetical protein EDB91DRAFT_210809 [Suillus paluster]